MPRPILLAAGQLAVHDDPASRDPVKLELISHYRPANPAARRSQRC
jgi:hypothetical protein